ncbi:unnamed protein product [Ambrosiozyma monospora]|uniref:FAD synthase n=1 Tax=Ambrosiozyma monospora TaxID=43982 RepID=A0A9W6SXZ8_AMBMO|nr:unnamed protein product [Ambrosiozyma monospora]
MTYSPLFQTCKMCNDLVESFLNNPAPYTSISPSPYPEFHNEDLHLQTQKQVRNTINVISEALDKFSLDELSISYNGGKDCLVMLIIYLSTIYSHFAKNNIDKLTNTKLHSVYINSEATFPEQDQFLDESVGRYNLNITKYENCSLVDGFREYLDENKNIKAIMVGIRKIDPYGATLSNFNKTDHGWPDFIRVHPILQFTTCEIWFFLKSLDIPYCELYDRGYTSLGGVDNTIPNPLLKDDKSKNGYLPAYMLLDDEHERLSRTSDKKKKSHEEKL